MAYRAMGSRDEKYRRSIVASDEVWHLWDEVYRRAKMLKPGCETTGDSVLRAACYALFRQQEREARLRMIDLTPPPTIVVDQPKPESEPFLGPARPPEY